jgi:hypothetical protein
MLWLVTFLVVILADTATAVQRPALVMLALLMLAMSMWCSWSEDRRKRPRR